MNAGAPIALDGIAYGIDYLDAIVVVHLGDAHVHATWVRPASPLSAAELAAPLRDAYRACHAASRRVDVNVVNASITLEIPGNPAHAVVIRRVRAHVVACVFDATMQIGMARLVSARLTAAIEPELPRTGDWLDEDPRPIPPTRVRVPEDHIEREPTTLSFGMSRSRRFPPQPRATGSELERTRRILAYYEAHAPEPHVARHRLALRAGLTLLALDHPEALGPEAMVLLETAVEDILGVDRAELRRIA